MVTRRASVAELVRAARSDDADAFADLVERFHGMAYGYSLALLRDHGLAEDACQEAFVDAFRLLHQLRDDAAFPGWFRRIVLKNADRQRRSRLLALDLADIPGASDPLAAVIEAEERRVLREEVSALPERLRKALRLVYGDGLSVAETAAFLGVAPSAVKKRLFDGRARLRGSLPAPAAAAVETRPRDAVRLLIATRTGDARAAADVLARRPDLATLTEAWADPDEVHEYGRIGGGYTLVQRAAFMGHLDVVEALARAGSPLTARVGLDPLDLAVLVGETAIVRLLLAAGAPVDAAAGCLTPLHRAAMRGDEEIARILLGAGARPAAPGPGGRTPGDWAELKGHRGLAAMLRE